MNRLPKIGERVRYHSVSEWWDRTCTGTVTKHYPGYEGDSLRTIPVGAPEWNEHWSAAVKVDAPLPEWWAYPGTDQFAPSIKELEPLK
jgi:hypothetical protein